MPKKSTKKAKVDVISSESQDSSSDSAKGRLKSKTKSKAKAKPKNKPIAKQPSKKKLLPGRKLCHKCKTEMAIHKKICNNCGALHEMRKKKQDIMGIMGMKNLSKITPIVIKNVMENDQFNEFRGWMAEDQNRLFEIGQCKSIQGYSQQKLLKKMPQRTKSQQKPPSRRKSNQSQPSNPSAQTQGISFNTTNNEDFFYLKLLNSNSISSVANSKKYTIFVETVKKQIEDLDFKQQATISAYELSKYNLVGRDYKGESNLYFHAQSQDQNVDPTKIKFRQIAIKRYISKTKIFCNLVAALTGQSTLLIFSLPKNLSDHRKSNVSNTGLQLFDNLQIIQPFPDRITAFQFLRSTAKFTQQSNPKVKIVTGTLFSRLSIYQISKSGYNIVRFIINGHFQMITVITQCPLSSSTNFEQKSELDQKQGINQEEESVLFATGSYDGTVAVWNLHETNPILKYQCSNRKILNISWDPGCKFLFINRDQLTDNCIILCFYSITKIEQKVYISTCIQTRTVKTQTTRTITNYDNYGHSLPILDPISGIFRMMSMQQLRSNSLKKKKPKKEGGVDQIYKISINEHIRHVTIQKIQQEMQTIEKFGKCQKIQKGQVKRFPIFSEIAIQKSQKYQNVFIATYNGILVLYRSNATKN